MASNCFTGYILVRINQKPRYSISVCPNNILSILHLSPFALIFSITSSNLFKWLYQSPLVIINRSSMYDLINSIPRNISFNLSWKISGELHTPIGRRLYLYFPHGRMIVHKLHSSLFFFFLLFRPPRSQSLLIMGWCSSIPEHRL